MSARLAPSRRFVEPTYQVGVLQLDWHLGSSDYAAPFTQFTVDFPVILPVWRQPEWQARW